MKTPPLLLGAGAALLGLAGGPPGRGRADGRVARGRTVRQSALGLHRRGFPADLDLSARCCCSVRRFTPLPPAAGRGNFGPLPEPNLATERNAGNASARTIAALIRWLPMIFFLFVAAQAFSSREGIRGDDFSHHAAPVAKGAAAGRPLPAGAEREYFLSCISCYACSRRASTPAKSESFYWGLCALVAWALWPHRSRRFSVAVWPAPGGGHSPGLRRPAGRRADIPAALRITVRSGSSAGSVAARTRCRARRRWATLAG